MCEICVRLTAFLALAKMSLEEGTLTAFFSSFAGFATTAAFFSVFLSDFPIGVERVGVGRDEEGSVKKSIAQKFRIVKWSLGQAIR